VAAVVLVAAAVAVAGLGTAANPLRRPEPAASARPAGSPPGNPRPPVSPVPPLPTPPFDTLPGRTPIPDPTRTGWAVRGRLPALGGPDEAAAVRAAGLVLGRYCAQPAAYRLTAAPEPDWRRVSVLVFTIDRSGDRPRIGLRLSWTGRAYDWAGTPVQLAGC